MTDKRERPLSLDMPFDEALERFIGTDPAELPENVKLRQKKPPPKRGPGVAGKPSQKA
jgi:hypothetical protein